MLGLLNRSDADIVRQINELDPNAVATRFRRRRLDRLLADIRRQQIQVREALGKELTEELRAVAENERLFQRKLLLLAAGRRVVNRFDFVTAARVKAAATSRPFQSLHLRWATTGEHVDELFRRRIKLVQDQIRIGIVEAQSTPQIVRSIRGTATLGFQDGILEVSRRAANTMTRTAVNHVANASRQVMYEENEDIIIGIRYLAILDNRTTAICRALDGQVFPIDQGPRPPQHPNCRSSTAPILASLEELGIDAEDTPASKALRGEVPPYQTYNEWLRTQPVEFVEEVLGKTKARLYLDGKLSLDRFVDRTGAELTIEELRRKENQAFIAAGVD